MLKTGQIIKDLRKKQDVTQEKLADYLNISYQAISKWENGTALPDITLIPKIANFFGVTADELLGLKGAEDNEELKEYERQYRENNRNGRMLDNIKLSREVLEKYPRHYQWMLNLAYPLIQYNDTDEHRRFGKEHGFLEEAIKICETILEDCTTDSIRHSAIQILCYSYPFVGKRELAIEMAYEMPEMALSKEALLFHALEGEKKINCAQENLMSLIDMSAGLIVALSSLMKDELTLSERVSFIKTANTLYKLILESDENSLFFNCRLTLNYTWLARLYAQLGEAEKVIQNLLLAEKTARAYDENDDLGEQKYQSPLVNRCTWNPKTTGKNFEASNLELLKKALNKDVFNAIQNEKEIIDLKKRLEKI